MNIDIIISVIIIIVCDLCSTLLNNFCSWGLHLETCLHRYFITKFVRYLVASSQYVAVSVKIFSVFADIIYLSYNVYIMFKLK